MNRSRVTGDLASHGNIFVDIANDRVGIGSTIPGQKLSLPDNAKIALGNSADQQLYHDGTLGHLQNNTGHFVNDISGHFYVRNLDGSKTRILAKSNGAVELYYNGTKMLETNIPSGHNGEVILGQKVHVRHTGSGNGQIFPSSGNLYLNAKDGETSIVCVRDAGVHLTFDNTTKFTTQAYGVNVTGTTDTDGLVVSGVTTTTDHINIDADSKKLTIGDAQDLELYHNGSNSFIVNKTGYLQINATETEVGLYVNPNAAVRLAYDGDMKFETTASGARVFNGASGGGILEVYSGDAGSAAGPEIKLYRNSSSPADADYLGQIKFAGESDTGVERNYAKITGKILDASNGTEDGIIEFSHIKAGSQVITGRFRSDSLQLLNGTNLSVAGDTTFTGDIDVDGHTELDNVTIAGIVTASSATISGNQILGHGNSTGNQIKFTRSGLGDELVIGTDGYGNSTQYEATIQSSIVTGRPLVFATNNTERFRIAGGGTITIAANSDMRFINGTWSGDVSGNTAKIQHHSNILYISGGSSGIYFRENNANRWIISDGGHFIPGVDSTYDIGTSGARVRNGYFDTLYGDGSNLTGITQTTINNNANNRIITGSGTANTLEAESTVTWDGTQFIIRSSDAITSFNGSKALTIQGGDAVGEYVNLAFNGNGYQLGVISGYTYGTNGTGGLVFSTTNSGSVNSRMIINQNGHLQPSTDSTYDLGLTGTRWRNVYADTLYGDGSNLTGITQTTINNNANNRIITGSGTANTLEAESKLTFDGTNLRVDQGNTSDGIVGQAYSGYFGLKHADQTYGNEYMILSSDNHTYISASAGSHVYIRNGNNDSTNQLIVSSGANGLTWRGSTVWHAGNDGSGTGLDADTVDGLHSSSFVRNLQNSGHNIQFGSGSNTGHTPSSYAYAIFQEGGAWTHPYPDLRLNYHTGIVMAANASYGGIRFQRDYNDTTELMSIGNGDAHVRVANNLYANGGNTVWNASNDGSGSGLDADTVDGTHANSLIRSGAQSSVSGWHISGYRNGSGTSPHMYFSHSSGYGMHINTYNTSGSIYCLELHSNTKNLFNVYNDGTAKFGGSAVPWSNNSYDLGTSSARWRNIYSQDLNVIKASGNLSGTFVASSGLGTLEIGGSTGAFIDLKTPSSDDYDMRIGTAGSGGYVTVPSGQSVTFNTYVRQSALIHFDVKLTSGTSSGDIKFNVVLENVGSHYSTSTGRFTAPIAGVYHFAGTVLQNNSGSQFDVNLRYNNSSNNKGNSMRATFTGHSTIQISETLKMNANDYVHINVSSGSLHHDGSGNWCGFQGTLIG